MRSPRSCLSIAAVVLATALSACVLDQLFSPNLPADLTVEIAGDSLLSVGDTIPVEARVLSEGGVVEGVRLSFTSSRPTVAEITADGQVAVLSRDTFSITAKVTSGSLAGDPPSVTAAFRGVAHRIVASRDTVLFSSLTATRQLTATGVSLGDQNLPGVEIAWSSESPGVVSVDSAGLLLAASNGGPVLVIAAADNRADTVRVVVRQRTGTITVSPGDAALRAAGETIQFSAELSDSLDQSNSVSDVTWSSTVASVVSVDGNGLATAGVEGIANIIAVSDGVADTARVLVSRLMEALVVTPEFDTLTAVGETTQLSATGTDDGGNHVAAPFVRWRSLNEVVAVVDTSGVVTATGSDDALIVGESGGVEDTVTVTVNQIVASVSISSPEADTTFTSIGDTAAFVAVARDANNYPIPGTGFAWSAEDTTVAVVNVNGNVVSRAVGSTGITAEADGFVGSVTVTVEQWLASMAVFPDTVNLAYGETHQLRAEAYDARGSAIPGVGFSWDSRDWGIVSVDGDGWISPQGDGATWVLATAGGFSDSSLVHVGPLASMCADGTPHEIDITADETWTLAGSPHCVGGWVSIIGGARLTIEAGVTVKFTAGSILRLGRSDISETGSLFAEGTEATPILFTPFNNSGSRGQWQGVQLEWVGANDSLVLRNATIEYAGQDNSGTISNRSSFSGTAVLDHVTIREGLGSGIDLQNGGTASSTLIVENSVIENNQWSGITLADGAASITNTRIIGNGSYGIRGNQSGGSLSSSGNRIVGNGFPLRLTSDLLGGVAGQNIDSLLGNTNDTLIVGCCGAVSATDTLRASPKLPWRINADELEFVGNTVWKIEAGATIRMTQGTQLVINGGALIADGDTAQILFTSENQNRGAWNFLWFKSTTDTSLLRNVELRYGGGGGVNATLQIESSITYPVILDTVRVIEGDVNGIQLSGPTIVTGPVVADSNNWSGMRVEIPNVTLADSRFVGNGDGGLWSSDAARRLTVLRSQLTDNGDAGALLYGDSTTVDSSILSRNGSDGLRVWYGGYAPRAPVVRNNTIAANNDNGLDVSGSEDAVVENNQIINNGGAGAVIPSASSISGNRVSGNVYPLRIAAASLTGMTGQNIDSLLGNDGDTLFIQCCGNVSTADTIRAHAALPWRVEDAGDIHFQNGAVWMIEAGATINAQNTSFFIDDGVVVANGDMGAPILFTSPNRSPGDWGALVFNNGADTSRLRHVQIRYGGGRGRNAALEISNGLIVLDSVLTARSGTDGFNVGRPRYFAVRGPLFADSCNGNGLNLQAPNVTLADSRFLGNGWVGVYSNATATGLTILRSRLRNNSHWGAELNGGNSRVENSNVSGNATGGIRVQSSSATIRGDTIQSNTGPGLDLWSVTTSVVENNLITDNGDAGARIGNASSVQGNRIRGNLYPVMTTAYTLGRMTRQIIDSLLGNDGDTLFIEGGGNISTTDTVRTTAALPWQLNNAGDVRFQNGTAWKIEAGATILSQNSGFVVDDGVLLAMGEASAPILFTSWNESPNSWGGLTINNGPDTTRLQHVEFRYGSQNRGATLRLWDGEIVLDDVTVMYSGNNGIEIGAPRYFAVRGPIVADSNSGSGMVLSAPDVTLADSRFVGNDGSGVYSHSGATGLTISRTRIVDNGNWGAQLSGTNTTVENSYVWSNTNGGIYLNGSSAVVRGDTIRENTGRGLDVWDGSSDAIVENNLIIDNVAAGARIANAVSVSGNRIRGNQFPLRVSSNTLGGMASQDVDSLLGNDTDTLFIDCCGSISATDTVRTRSALPWVVSTGLDFVSSTVWKLEPGARVITSGSHISMGGRAMIADGGDQGIVITGRTRTPGSWGQLWIGATADSSRLRNVTLRFGGGHGMDFALKVEASSTHPTVLDSVGVARSSTGGIYVGGPTVVRRFIAADSVAGTGLQVGWNGLSIPAGRFSYNGGWGVEVRAGDFSLDNALVHNNGAGGSSGGVGIWGSQSSITNSWIHDNSGQGVYTNGDGSTHTVAGDTIENNGSNGAEFHDADITFTDNIVRNNTQDGVHGNAGDWQVFSGISGNTVTGNGGYPLVLDGASLGPFSMQDQSTLVGNTRDTLCVCTGPGDVTFTTGSPRVTAPLPWKNQMRLTVGGSQTLTLEPGAALVMGNGAALYIGVGSETGTLRSLGTAASPVWIVGETPSRGFWNQLSINAQNDSSVLRHTVIAHGGGGGLQQSLHLGDAFGLPIRLDTVTARGSASNAVWANGSAPLRIVGLSAFDNDASGLVITEGTIAVTGSRFERNGEAGIRIDGGSGHSMLQSILSDNVNWGLLNNTGDLVTAINNWWGDASGPSGSGAGTGDAVSGNVSFNPWLVAAPTVP